MRFEKLFPHSEREKDTVSLLLSQYFYSMDTYTIVERYRDSDSPYMMPEGLYPEFVDILREGENGLPIVHKLKEFIKQHPDSLAEAGQELAVAYFNKNDLTRANETIDKILQVAPDFVHAVILKAELFIENEDFEAVESLIDLDMDFAFHFPGRKKVSVVELADYEFISILWKIVNEETEEAIDRSWNLLITLRDNKIAPEFFARLHDRFVDYIPEAEYSPGLNALLDHLENLVIQTPIRGLKLNHPECWILALQVLVPQDFSKVEQLFSLPEASFKADLYALIDDALAQPLYEKATEDNATHQVWLSMLILAGLNDENFPQKWIDILSADPLFIEIWLGAELLDELFYVGYRAGINDPAWLASQIDLRNHYYRSNVSLVTSLCCISWTNPEKKDEILELLSRITKQLLEMSPDESEDTRFLVAMVMEEVAMLDYDFFKNDIEQAENKGLLEAGIMQDLFRKAKQNYMARPEYFKLTEPIGTKLKRLWLNE